MYRGDGRDDPLMLPLECICSPYGLTVEISVLLDDLRDVLYHEDGSEIGDGGQWFGHSGSFLAEHTCPVREELVPPLRCAARTADTCQIQDIAWSRGPPALRVLGR